MGKGRGGFTRATRIILPRGWERGEALPEPHNPAPRMGKGDRTGTFPPLDVPSTIWHGAFRHTGEGGPGVALPCGRCRATIRAGLRQSGQGCGGRGGQGLAAFPRLAALFPATHRGEYIKDKNKGEGSPEGRLCRRRCRHFPVPSLSPPGPPRAGHGHGAAGQRGHAAVVGPLSRGAICHLHTPARVARWPRDEPARPSPRCAGTAR